MRAAKLLTGAVAVVGLLSGCTAPVAFTATADRIQVVTTTGILADLVRNVGGDRVLVDSIVPDSADSHTYEPTLRDVRNIVYADLAFSNYLLLEAQSVVRTLDANLRPEVPNISLAEGATKYAAEIIPMVEDASLDTIWLGLRVRGTGQRYGANRSSDILLSATEVTGPGRLVGYLTESFGNPDVYFDSADGFDPGTGYRDDTATLPPDAHTHMSWAFTEPGVYRLTVRAQLRVNQRAAPVELGRQRFTFAVGVDPHSVPGFSNPAVLGRGHADIAVDVDAGRLHLYADPHGGGETDQQVYDPATTVIEVPNKGLLEIPSGRSYRFLGRAGDRIFQLPQAVLGKHVHGEIDPHLWQDVGNAQSYVELIRDTLIGVDPAGAATYRRNAEAYLAELGALDTYLTERIASIPPVDRHLVTTHDAFAYLARAYGIPVAGFVTPSPATEPSLADRVRLTETIRNLRVKAVFLEPDLRARSATLVEVAREQGVRVCPIYGDTFSATVDTYLKMMRFNADSLVSCLRP
ncbi:anchored repeat ABC transporter, substrate-binding protein [Micromonospora sp. NBC_01796]|uniref:anchored repeat ABC transporter, substrate-binding protein n=1 Tax=Micromonospora sp. NBC_01796 TaxID=2975987 RepID=UPI002DDB4618|nr:anchored repeat ABC transporter, substrate-binding protein [Micromonospora sp. NBC_01796]WSA82825.1 anchored repeat ABC transporter, substrate-binding protein [Micromonospora sp. NBC_01796]